MLRQPKFLSPEGSRNLHKPHYYNGVLIAFREVFSSVFLPYLYTSSTLWLWSLLMKSISGHSLDCIWFLQVSFLHTRKVIHVLQREGNNCGWRVSHLSERRVREQDTMVQWLHTGCSSRVPEFSSQNPHGGSQSPISPVLGIWCLSLVSMGTRRTCDTQTHIQTKHSYT